MKKRPSSCVIVQLYQHCIKLQSEVIHANMNGLHMKCRYGLMDSPAVQWVDQVWSLENKPR